MKTGRQFLTGMSIKAANKLKHELIDPMPETDRKTHHEHQRG
jgi:hypothetical protein